MNKDFCYLQPSTRLGCVVNRITVQCLNKDMLAPKPVHQAVVGDVYDEKTLLFSEQLTCLVGGTWH